MACGVTFFNYSHSFSISFKINLCSSFATGSSIVSSLEIIQCGKGMMLLLVKYLSPEIFLVTTSRGHSIWRIEDAIVNSKLCSIWGDVLCLITISGTFWWYSKWCSSMSAHFHFIWFQHLLIYTNHLLKPCDNRLYCFLSMFCRSVLCKIFWAKVETLWFAIFHSLHLLLSIYAMYSDMCLSSSW